jgi:thiol-disulfide isomerase/thioredoxin
MKNKIVFCLMLLAATSCARRGGHTGALQEGMWRGVLHRTDGAAIPFNFQVSDTAGRTVLYIVNGKGRLLVDSIRRTGDSVYIHMPFFNSDFATVMREDGSLSGRWIKHYPDTDRILGFAARPHAAYRLVASPAPPAANVTGRWKAAFTTGGDSSTAVGEFTQQGSRVTGTFLTVSGDDRYLQGVMDGDTLRMSAFDGSHVFLFSARAAGDSLKGGVFYAGFAARERWSAVRDSTAHLPDAFGLTSHRKGEDRLSFTFPDLKGHRVSLDDARFRGKVVIVQILGSWCPNCMDETRFLSRWYRQNNSRGVAIIGLCYERPRDFGKAVSDVMTFKDRFDVTYPLLITGVQPSDPQLLQKTLPQLQHFVGFPTTIFLNRAGDIARIHAGFSGPGTGEHYTRFIGEFNHLVDSLAGTPSGAIR